MLSLKGKVAIVTGAGSVGPGWGNGKATAVLLARQGAKVFGLDNNPAAVEETIGIIKAEGGEATAGICDVLDSESFQAAVEACIARYGQLDIMVNNVGGSHPGGAESAGGFQPEIRFSGLQIRPSPSEEAAGECDCEYLLHRRLSHASGAAACGL